MRAWLDRSTRRLLVALLAMTSATLPASAQTPKPARPASPSARRPASQSAPASRVWHTPTAGKTAPVDERGRSMLVLQALNTPDRVELVARSDRGGFSAEDLDRAAHVLRDHRTGNEHPIEPRLLDFIYRLETHFHAHEIRVISGYRTPRGRATSNHGKGRAIDLVVPGASDQDVARLARDEGFAGVGVYPVSGFVHLDVRERSYFWVDASGPGRRSRTRGILADLAARSDAAAIARGERPIGPFLIGGDVDAALGSTALASTSAPPVVEEDEAEVPTP